MPWILNHRQSLISFDRERLEQCSTVGVDHKTSCCKASSETWFHTPALNFFGFSSKKAIMPPENWGLPIHFKIHVENVKVWFHRIKIKMSSLVDFKPAQFKRNRFWLWWQLDQDWWRSTFEMLSMSRYPRHVLKQKNVSLNRFQTYRPQWKQILNLLQQWHG